jgi:DNA-binding FadR family transcriptional regulator
MRPYDPQPSLSADWGLSDWVVLEVLDGVRQGVFTPGQRLNGEELARLFEVSSALVRDAMRKLEQIGVIERRLPRGAYVREWTDKDRIHSGLLEALHKGDLDAAIAGSLQNARESREVLLQQTINDGRPQLVRSEQRAEG